MCNLLWTRPGCSMAPVPRAEAQTRPVEGYNHEPGWQAYPQSNTDHLGSAGSTMCTVACTLPNAS
jgi:hypothetical protein